MRTSIGRGDQLTVRVAPQGVVGPEQRDLEGPGGDINRLGDRMPVIPERLVGDKPHAVPQ